MPKRSNGILKYFSSNEFNNLCNADKCQEIINRLLLEGDQIIIAAKTKAIRQYMRAAYKRNKMNPLANFTINNVRPGKTVITRINNRNFC